MNLNGLAKHYDCLDAEERWTLIVRAHGAERKA